MLDRLINARTLKLAVFAVAMAILAAVVSVPAGAAKAKTLSQSELKGLIANAKTAADHERIAQHFDSEAAKYEAESKDHGELAVSYQAYARSSTVPYKAAATASVRNAEHCNGIGSQLRNAAEDARQLAAEHRGMAKEAK
ncbi:MAG TPA: hypothetical protein VEV41_22545 [Terriglobales bacterium]|nr:hypothetical protein [Terriglobales bacterium]